jgi:hypothetical protein
MGNIFNYLAFDSLKCKGGVVDHIGFVCLANIQFLAYLKLRYFEKRFFIA